MATVAGIEGLRNHPVGVTVLLTAVGYALVVGTFLFDVPIYPDLTNAQVNALTHAIAVVNSATTVLLVLGWYWIRTDRVQRHRFAMSGAFGLIILFLVIYLLRVGGGGEKYITGVTDPVYYAYLGMLGIHIALSILAVPVVLYALILGLSHSPTELRSTAHAKIGRIAAASWILSLVLGIVTYLMLNHVYEYEFASMIVTA